MKMKDFSRTGQCGNLTNIMQNKLGKKFIPNR